jgi:hypothetical protein
MKNGHVLEEVGIVVSEMGIGIVQMGIHGSEMGIAFVEVGISVDTWAYTQRNGHISPQIGIAKF